MSPKKKIVTKTNIIDKVILISVNLQKINGVNLLQTSSFNDEAELKTDWTCNIKSFEKDKLVLSADFKMFFTPESLFNIDLSYNLYYRCLKEISTDEIKKNMETLIRPCSDVNSLLIGIITEKFGSLPVILNPEVHLSNQC